MPKSLSVTGEPQDGIDVVIAQKGPIHTNVQWDGFGLKSSEGVKICLHH